MRKKGQVFSPGLPLISFKMHDISEIPLSVTLSSKVAPLQKFIQVLIQFESFLRTNWNEAQVDKFVFHRIEIIVGKGRECWLPALSPFPTIFSKVFFLTPYHTIRTFNDPKEEGFEKNTVG